MRNKKQQLTEKQFRTIFFIVLIIVVTVISILLALLGTRVYKNSTDDKAQQSFCDAAAYFTEFTRQCEESSRIRTASLRGELPALVISRESGKTGEITESWYFTYGGWLKNANVPEGSEVTADSGDAVMPLESVEFHMLKSNLLEIIMVTEANENAAINLYLPGNGGAADE